MSKNALAPQQQWQQRWQQLATRERFMVSTAAALLACALIWWIGIAPALNRLKQASVLEPQLAAQLQRMRSQAQEVTALKAQRSLSPEESRRALESSIKTLGAGASLSINDNRAVISLKNVSADALAQWLAQVRANARLTPSELRLRQAAALATPATGNAATAWDGDIVISLNPR